MRPAIVLGLGGTGARIVDQVYGRIPEADRDKAVFFVFDTDLGDMSELKHLDPVRDVISIGRTRTVQQILVEQGGETRFQYLDQHRDILGNNMADGAAQVRMISRFAFETLRGDAAERIANKINKISSNKYTDRGANLYLVSSVCGGTGSGLVLPLAFSLKNYLSQQLNRTLLVKAVTLFPDIYALSSDVGMESKEKKRIRSNAYAFFKEWKTYNDVFRGEYKHEEFIDLLNLKLLDLGNITSLTPDKLKKNSDLLDPIDFFIGIDAVGAQNTTLQRLENYEKMTANYLFLDLVSNMGSQAESKMDNALSSFVTSGGMTKFASFGSSSIIYPYEDILKFAPATLMLSSLSDRWMRIDDEFEDEYKEYLDKKAKDTDVKEPVLKDFYVQKFDEYVQTGFQQNYYSNLYNTLKLVSENEYGMQIGVSTYENIFYEKMLGHLNQQIETRTFDYKGQPKAIVSLADDIKDELNNVSTDYDDFEVSIEKIENLKSAFMFKAESESERIARDLTRNYINMDDVDQSDIDREKEALHNLSHYILGDKQKALHPVAVRYFLYKLAKRLKAEKEEYFKIEYVNNEQNKTGLIPGLEYEIQRIKEFDYYRFNDKNLKEDIFEAIKIITEQGRGSAFSRIFIGRDLRDVLNNYRDNTNQEVKLIQRYYQSKVTYEVLDSLEKRVNLLIEYWEELFKTLKRSISDERTFLRKIEYEFGIKNQSEDVLGALKLFNTYELRRDFVFDRLKNSNFSEDEFDYKVTSLFYKDALSDFSNYPFKKKKEEIINKKYGEIVLKSLEQELRKQGVFDINIIEALADEAIIKGVDKKEYIQQKLDSIAQQAGPFMNPTMDSQQKRSFNSWGIHEDSDETLRSTIDDEEYVQLFGEKNVLTQEDSSVDMSKRKYESYISTAAISRYEIIRNNFDYNFGLKNLQSFSSSIGMNKDLNLKNVFSSGGTIYNNYYEHRLDQWAKDEVSCHLDKRWDSLFVLNDINEGVDALFEKEIKKAFIRGLIMNWFKNFKDNETGEITWKFEFLLDSDKYVQYLKYSDGKPAGGTFYNLYQALLNNLGLVLKINGYSDNHGQYQKGFFDQQFDHELNKKHHYGNWNEHKFIKEIKGPIPYKVRSGSFFNVIEVIFKLFKESNEKKIKELSKDLLIVLIDELIAYQKRFGQDTYTMIRVRNVIKDLLRESRCAKDPDCGKGGMRETWIELILSKLRYKTRDIELKDIFIMKNDFYVDENKDADNEDNQ